MVAVPPHGGSTPLPERIRALGGPGISVAWLASVLIDSENTPAQGLAALRRRRQGKFARHQPPTFIDFSMPLAHAEALEDVRIAAGGTRLFTRVRVRHALPQASSPTLWAWSPGEVAGSGLMSGDVSGFDCATDGRALALWSLEKGYFNVVEPTTLRSRTIGWRTPRVGRWGVRFEPREACLSPDGSAVAVLGERGQLAVYAPLDGLGPELTLAEGVHGVAWSPASDRLAVVDAHEVTVFELATGERGWRVARPRPNERACHVAWDPTGQLLLLASAEVEPNEGSLRSGRAVFVERDNARGAPELRWAQDGSLAARLPYEVRATRIAWSDDGARCLLVARPGGLLVWDSQRHQPVVHDPAVATASFGPRGEWLALAEEGAREVLVRWLP